MNRKRLGAVVAVLAAARYRPVSRDFHADLAPTPAETARANGFKRLSWIANLGGTFGGSLIVHLLPGLAVTIGGPAGVPLPPASFQVARELGALFRALTE